MPTRHDHTIWDGSRILDHVGAVDRGDLTRFDKPSARKNQDKDLKPDEPETSVKEAEAEKVPSTSPVRLSDKDGNLKLPGQNQPS